MDVALILGLFRRLSELRTREAWPREHLERYQAEAVQQLRAHAYARSPFYRRFHAGLESAPFEALPVLTKSLVMAHFDELVTDDAVRLATVQAHMQASDAGSAEDPLQGRYWVSATSGSTGQPGLFVFSRDEWLTVLASFARAHEWAGVQINWRHRMRMASVASTNRWHMSTQVGASLASWWMPALRLAATDSLDDMVEALNGCRPDMLVAYPSVARVLAEEQLAGRLKIAPHLVFTSAEVLTTQTRQRITDAWGHSPFNQYAATETGGIAAECAHHHGLHLFEDLVLVEIVDDDYRPVPDGAAGSRLLVTTLFSRTQPLIRYEITDQLTLAADPCVCGRPFRVVAAVAGRAEDVLQLPAHAGGSVTVHPLVFHELLDPTPVSGWQVVQTPTGLEVLLSGSAAAELAVGLAAAVQRRLEDMGAAQIDVTVREVETIPRGPGGKAPLVRALRPNAEVSRTAPGE